MSETMMPAVESGTRSAFFATLRDAEWATSGNGEDLIFTGTAAVFNSWSEPLWTPRGAFRERILPGAFDQVLAGKPDVRLLKNHDKNFVLARTKSGTLELTADDEGLRVWARVARTSYALDLKMEMERRDIDQMSLDFDFDPDAGAQDRWYEDKETREIRRDVIRVSGLWDVSPVTFPAYVDTTAAMRSLERQPLAQQRERRPLARPHRYTRTLQVISESPWAIEANALGTILSVVAARAEGEKLTNDEIRERIGSKRERQTQETPGVAVIEILGPIVPRANLFTEVSGMTAVQDIQSALRAALADPSVASILFDIDSPGGVGNLVPELAEEIRQARGQKPIVAVANAMAASAAYWIGTAADELVVTPSGEVGAVGVYAAHEDWSKFMEDKGIKTTLVSAGKFKTEANPFEPLSDEAKAELQRGVDEFYKMFVAAVAKQRGVSRDTVRSDFGQGRVVSAKRAVAAGMADQVGTFDETLARMLKAAGATPRPQPAEEEPVDLDGLPDDVFGSRQALRSVLGLRVAARAETDPAGAAANGDTDEAAPAETDPAEVAVDPLAALKARSKGAVQREGESYLRLKKELAR